VGVADVRVLFRLRGSRARSFEAPTATWPCTGRSACSPATWLVLTGTGHMLLYWSLGERPLRRALLLSGSSIYPLGFEVPPNLPTTVLAFSEAGSGLVLLAVLISCLPSMYQSFQRREAAVAALDVPADTPPTAAALLIRSSIIGGWDRLEELWREWESWFVDVTETHTSLLALVFFRSPHREHSPTSSTSGTTPTRTGRRSRSRSTGASSTGPPAAGRGRVPLKDDLDQAPRDFAGPGLIGRPGAV
jgi:hypothetical protein